MDGTLVLLCTVLRLLIFSNERRRPLFFLVWYLMTNSKAILPGDVFQAWDIKTLEQLPSFNSLAVVKVLELLCSPSCPEGYRPSKTTKKLCLELALVISSVSKCVLKLISFMLSLGGNREPTIKSAAILIVKRYVSVFSEYETVLGRDSSHK